jgi:RNA polymerase sigma factor (sigma-70 family)
MPKDSSTKYGHLTDSELVELIQENQDYLGEVYKRCKQYSISFMRKKSNSSINDYELDDVFHDAILILYEKIIKGNFELTASLQVYLNSVCYYQLLNKINANKKETTYDDNSSDDDEDSRMSYISTITDVLDEIEDYEEELFKAMERALEKMKATGSHCYELITLFWYHKKSHLEIAKKMNYSNDKTSKKQKSGCQERLRTMSYNELKKI